MYTKMEITALKRLTRVKCPHTPKLLSILRKEQDSTMWVPGGWLIFILMEKVPGEPLDHFWKPSMERPAMTVLSATKSGKTSKKLYREWCQMRALSPC
jgi:hypothetical protein